MNIPETYDYLVRARRDLWATLESVPDEVLPRLLLDGDRLHCIKDLVFHVPALKPKAAAPRASAPSAGRLGRDRRWPRSRE